MSDGTKVLVRRAAAADLAQVLEIDRSTLYLSHWSPSDYEKYQSRGREDLFHRCLLVAADGWRVAGFAAGSFLEGEEAALVENLAVQWDWRRQGVARALLGGMMTWAKQEGASGLQLEVRVSNTSAQALYRSMSFREEGRRARYYSRPEEDGVLMGMRFEQVGLAKDL